jgi:hypothetical protein
MEQPAFLSRFNHRRYIYLALVQAALIEEVESGSAVYHGLAGHLLLKGVPGLLRVRIIAPLEFRIRMAGERMNLGRKETLEHIEKIDRDRQEWTKFLYGVEWGDPSLYDLVVNLESISLEQACGMVAALVQDGGFAFTPERRMAMSDIRLASRVRAQLARDPYTSHLEVEVESRGGSLTIRGDVAEEMQEAWEAIRRAAEAIPGVTSLTAETAGVAGPD